MPNIEPPKSNFKSLVVAGVAVIRIAVVVVRCSCALQEGVWLLANTHTIDGTGDRKINSDDLRSMSVKHVCTYTSESIPHAQTQGKPCRWIAAGDWNCTPAQFASGLVNLPSTAGNYKHVCDPIRQRRDFIVCPIFATQDFGEGGAMPIAHDQAHTAVGVICPPRAPVIRSSIRNDSDWIEDPAALASTQGQSSFTEPQPEQAPFMATFGKEYQDDEISISSLQSSQIQKGIEAAAANDLEKQDLAEDDEGHLATTQGQASSSASGMRDFTQEAAAAQEEVEDAMHLYMQKLMKEQEAKQAREDNASGRRSVSLSRSSSTCSARSSSSCNADFEPDQNTAALASTQGHEEERQQQDDEEERQQQDDTRALPNLPNLRGVVKSSNHVVSFSQELAHDAVQQLLLLRNRALTAKSLEPIPGTFLPFVEQKQCQKSMYNAWLLLPETVSRQRWMTSQGWPRGKVQRTLQSYYTKFQMEMYGGREWMFIIIAIGTIDEDIVQCVNDEIQARLCKNAGRHQQKRADRQDQTVKGVQHQVSYAKKWRTYCHQLDLQIQSETLLWDQGLSRMSAWEWRHLLWTRDHEWDGAEELSFRLGHRFKDRNGTWQCTEPKDLVGLSLRAWCLRKGVEFVGADE